MHFTRNILFLLCAAVAHGQISVNIDIDIDTDAIGNSPDTVSAGGDYSFAGTDEDAVAAASTLGSSPASVLNATASGGGRAVIVPAGASLQAALDAAQSGDTLILQAGATYVGNFLLRNIPGAQFITITTSQLASLPGPGKRISPAYASKMAKLVSPNGGPTLLTAPGAHHYKIIGIEFTTAAGKYNNGVVRLGNGTETTLAALPTDIDLDRVYIHGDPKIGSKRGVALNGIRTNVMNSYIVDFKDTAYDTQAICGWNGPGPFVISNNHLEASGEVIFIGEGAVIPGVTPSDILITRNHLTRPLAWRSQPSYNGARWLVKNLIELKAGKRVVIDSNLLEYNWNGGQTGFPILLKAGPNAKVVPAITDGVTITNNIIRHTGGGINIQGVNAKGDKVKNIVVRNNLFDDIGGKWGSPTLFELTPGTQNVVYENNTVADNAVVSLLFSADTGFTTGFVFRSNVMPHGIYGFKGPGQATGTNTLNKYYPGHIFTANVIYGANINPANYPPGNYFPALGSMVGFDANYALGPLSPYDLKGFNGADPGVNVAAVRAATATCVLGQ